MNHDYCHCMDYDKGKCPSDCFRAQLEEDIKKNNLYGVPFTYSSLKGTDCCVLGKKIVFPRDCWNVECPFFKVWDMSIDDLACYCEKLERQIDACDEDFIGIICPLYKEDEK